MVDIISVLHVEDNPDAHTLMKIFLKQITQQIKIDNVSTPNQALQILSKNNYDIVLTDYKMPGINGIEFVKNIREKSDIPIILYTP